MNTAQSFYDQFLAKLISDYAFGNLRIEQAIEFALKALPQGSPRILDIGFGLGWSSQEILRHLPQARVDGIDLSPKLVEFAGQLCQDPRATFRRQDLTEWTPDESELYDAVLMIDVYEHIPQQIRKAFHEGLRRVLKPGGILILTCPSKKHQDYLRKFNPEGLQPVDEDVTREVAEDLARDLGLKLWKFEEKQVWTQGDYNHILIGPAGEPQAPAQRSFRLQDPEERKTRLLKNCDIKAHAAGIVSTARAGRRVCIATPQLDVYSETFIRQHIEKLPFDVVVLSGHELGRTSGRDLLQRTRMQKINHRLRRNLGLFDQREFNSARIARWLAEEKIDMVLCEYGFTGLQLLDACRRAGVPLVVHFHGYDAHNEEAIAPHRDGYRRMFSQAAAIIAVSRAMCDQLRALGAPEDKIQHVPYYTDPLQFLPASPEQAPPVFLAVGRFVEKKAPHLTLLAFSKVLKAYPEARLEMVGDGPLLGACKWLVRSLGMEHAVTFHGSKKHDWIASAMTRSRAFVQHSVRAENGDSEGTPVAVLEAQCSGLPVIATSHTGIADVVEHGVTGFLCQEGDVGGMAQAMIQICKADAAALKAMSQASRERFAREFSYERTMGKLAGLIETHTQR